eukprot:CAMPEP_0184971552 /NCGR_PEP_ID=MMETSP1098-20130426/3773_1 /TAXON_ID=89044 /ORGANISM="Spumella elongata, Strain CCAP 955/1" /LENGTH=189 /DNA_ID=CAMNT_0027493699 /DNA_START=52 /DNA_END=621 /DNA_ORIENTATION=-
MSAKKRTIVEVNTVAQPIATKVKKSAAPAAVELPVVVDPPVELSAVDTVRAKMEDLNKQLLKVKYGKRWKDEQSAEAVRRLEAINYVYVIGLILTTITDVDDQWTLALEYTQQIAQIISTATQRAHKRVNGAWGEFCPDLAEIVATGLWKELCDKEERPNDEIVDNVVQQVFIDKIFGDYCDLSFVSEG